MVMYGTIFTMSSLLISNTNLIFPDEFLTVYQVSILDVMSTFTVAPSLPYLITVYGTFE